MANVGTVGWHRPGAESYMPQFLPAIRKVAGAFWNQLTEV